MQTATMDDLDRFLVSPAFYDDPYPTYRFLRDEDPVHWSDTVGGWLLTRYDDVLSTIRDPGAFSSQGRMLPALAHLPPEARGRLRPFEQHFLVGLISADPPDHKRLRTLVNTAFTPRVVERLRPRIQALVDELLDAVQGRGEMDLIRDFAYPLPATVIAELLGAPPEDRDRFKYWSEGILAFQGLGRVPLEIFERSQHDVLEMRAFIGDLLERRRRAPSDDLLSRLAAAEAAGDRLSEAEMLTMCVTLLVGGHETTTHLIGSGLLTLLRHPEQLRRLREEPGLMPTAVEEMLRYESPVQRNPRRVVEDVELGDKLLRRGDFVLQILGAANRDPAHFAEPERFDIAREPNRHVAFGYGIHFCVGAPLARLEAQLAIDTVLRRFPRLALVTDRVEWQEHGLLRALTALPVAF